MRTLYATLAVVLLLFASGKLPMQNKAPQPLPLVSKAEAAVPEKEVAKPRPMIPLTKYVSSRSCKCAVFGGRNCVETLHEVTVMVPG
ncbi:hypothetical protein A33M_3286 [Rhodovulum sp. PH10]|uniref:hypothetical protein n=1 Tax=Rhodovulum sp. PH10 TaxID=1187851 RepID=UPI00027C27D3|nr:hypothetical protein [Rhodovulum sp. PH10]EJW11275.1 hypothetical protein A33M_3286 [Rhodovulum sp. PH10]